MNKKEKLKPSVGSMYSNKSQKGTVYVTLRLKADLLPEADSSGHIHLIGFKNKSKKNDKSPDFWIEERQELRPSKSSAAPARAQKQQQEDEDDILL